MASTNSRAWWHLTSTAKAAYRDWRMGQAVRGLVRDAPYSKIQDVGNVPAGVSPTGYLTRVMAGFQGRAPAVVQAELQRLWAGKG